MESRKKESSVHFNFTSLPRRFSLMRAQPLNCYLSFASITRRQESLKTSLESSCYFEFSGYFYFYVLLTQQSTIFSAKMTKKCKSVARRPIKNETGAKVLWQLLHKMRQQISQYLRGVKWKHPVVFSTKKVVVNRVTFAFSPHSKQTSGLTILFQEFEQSCETKNIMKRRKQLHYLSVNTKFILTTGWCSLYVDILLPLARHKNWKRWLALRNETFFREQLLLPVQQAFVWVQFRPICHPFQSK